MLASSCRMNRRGTARSSYHQWLSRSSPAWMGAFSLGAGLYICNTRPRNLFLQLFGLLAEGRALGFAGFQSTFHLLQTLVGLLGFEGQGQREAEPQKRGADPREVPNGRGAILEWVAHVTWRRFLRVRRHRRGHVPESRIVRS